MLTNLYCKGPQKRHIHHHNREVVAMTVIYLNITIYICVCTYLTESGYKVVFSVYEARNTLEKKRKRKTALLRTLSKNSGKGGFNPVPKVMR